LHKVLSRYLSPSIVEYVMTQVFAAINHRLSEEYTKIELPSLEAKERLLADAKYLHQKLTGLKNVGAPTAMLELVVSEKSVARKAPPPVPVHQPPTTTQSRFKNMLHRADSTNVKRAPTPTPTSPNPVPDYEKTLPLPTSDPPAVVSITPSPTSPPPPHPLTPPPSVDAKSPNGSSQSATVISSGVSTVEAKNPNDNKAMLPSEQQLVASPPPIIETPPEQAVDDASNLPPPTPPKAEGPVNERSPYEPAVPSPLSSEVKFHELAQDQNSVQNGIVASPLGQS